MKRNTRMTRRRSFLTAAAAAAGTLLLAPHTAAADKRYRRRLAEVLARYETPACARLVPFFRFAGAPYPPASATLLAMKRERRLELWAGDDSAGFTFIRNYDIRKTSGGPGPKLREGDRQVPEGLYGIEALNPDSRFHLSMKLNYPNAFDRRQAQAEGRTRPGSDIFIHGKASSIGCLAMGDTAIEELFVLTARVGCENVRVVIAPRDPRRRALHADPDRMPAWTPRLYRAIAAEFTRYPRPYS